MSGLLQMSGIVVDLVHRVARLPASGAEVEAKSVTIAVGGGLNAMAAARRFGIEVAYGGVLGTGVFADLASAKLAELGIAALMQDRAAADQGTCVVLVEADGERSFVSHHGAERQLDEGALARIPIARFEWLLLSGYALYKEESARVLAPWLRHLKQAPRFLFDPSPMIAAIEAGNLDAALARADWISANAREAEVLTGLADPSAAARSLAAGRQGALVRRGDEGCWLALPESDAVHVPGLAVDAVDTTGAGDAHAGAFIAASVLGHAAHDAAILANAAAALSTTRHGPATAPDLSEVFAFLASRGIHLSRRQGETT